MAAAAVVCSLHRESYDARPWRVEQQSPCRFAQRGAKGYRSCRKPVSHLTLHRLHSASKGVDTLGMLRSASFYIYIYTVHDAGKVRDQTLRLVHLR